jgi:hypothetical protein
VRIEADAKDEDITVVTVAGPIFKLRAAEDGVERWSQIRKKYWIDEGRDSIVPRIETVLRLTKDASLKTWEPDLRQETTVTKWQKSAEVQVPIHCAINDRWELTLEWKHVNDEIDETFFTVESLGAKPDTKIVNRKGEKPFIE